MDLNAVYVFVFFRLYSKRNLNIKTVGSNLKPLYVEKRLWLLIESIEKIRFGDIHYPSDVPLF